MLDPSNTTYTLKTGISLLNKHLMLWLILFSIFPKHTAEYTRKKKKSRFLQMAYMKLYNFSSYLIKKNSILIVIHILLTHHLLPFQAQQTPCYLPKEPCTLLLLKQSPIILIAWKLPPLPKYLPSILWDRILSSPHLWTIFAFPLLNYVSYVGFYNSIKMFLHHFF